MTAYLDPRTGQIFPLDPPRWRAPDGSPLLLTPMSGLTRDAIDGVAPGLWRYRAALPPFDGPPITLGEGMTPLLRLRRHGADVLVKGEWANPTGSFKDRGASVMLSLLRAHGVDAVLEDSSGNGGAAIAAYAAAGGLRATILAPAATSSAKTLQMRAYGAEVTLIEGSRQDVADAAARRTTPFYASHNWHPFFLHGTKTLAYELWEQLGFRAPDNVVIPCGAGSNVLGCEIGFSELLRAGQIETLPRLFAAQPAACAPIAHAFLSEDDDDDAAMPWPRGPTIAEGTAIARPVRAAAVLGALRATEGGAVMLAEAEIVEATLSLARAGVFVEPTCAQADAALARLLGSGAITPDQTTVMLLTGSGLKAATTIGRLLDERA